MDDCAGETSNYLFNQDNFFSHFAYCFGMIHLCLDYLFIETWQIYNCAFMCEIYKKKKKKTYTQAKTCSYYQQANATKMLQSSS